MVNLDVLQGSNLSIESLTLNCLNEQLDITAIANIKTLSLSILFTNVSTLCIRYLSYPICLECMEVIDNLSRGWMPEVRFHVRDLENHQIEFYCQQIIINIFEREIERK